jgi:hypothetical protein
MDEPTPPQRATDTCPNCGQAAMAAYCSQCGEKRRDRADWKLSSIVGEAFAELINLEHSKIWQTFRLLLFKPGQLSRDYWNGRRKRYIGPVKLYLVCFALSLVLYSFHQPTAIYDVRSHAATDSTGNIARVFEEQASKRRVSTEQLMQEINLHVQRFLSMSQLLYPLPVALTLQILLRRHRLYFAEHLVFALHLIAFMFLSVVVLWPLFLLVGVRGRIDQFTPSYLVIMAGSMIWPACYALLALRRAYGETWWAAIVKGSLIFLTYMITFLLFVGIAFKLALTLTQHPS